VTCPPPATSFVGDTSSRSDDELHRGLASSLRARSTRWIVARALLEAGGILQWFVIHRLAEEGADATDSRQITPAADWGEAAVWATQCKIFDFIVGVLLDVRCLIDLIGTMQS
jgi:hypothetical protein